jgi:hypothetical protein
MGSHTPNVKPTPDYYKDLGWDKPFVWERPDFAGWDAVRRDIDRIVAEDAARKEAERQERKAERQERNAEWKLQRPDAPPPDVETLFQVPKPAPEPKPLRLVPSLPPEEERAWQEAVEARRRQERIIQELHAHPAVKRPGCGEGGSFYIRKIEHDRCADAVTRPWCGRSDCDWCWRGRLTKDYHRAARCLLYRHGRHREVRVEPVHLDVIPFEEWPALNRKLRRQHGEDCGRLRVRMDDDQVLVVCQHPFPGAASFPPAEALDRVNRALEVLSKAPHSYRQLGSWSDREESGWKLLGHLEEAIDLDLVERVLRELGHSCRKFKRPEIRGRIWETGSEAEADDLFRRLAKRCHFSSHSKSSQKSDTPSGGGYRAPGLTPKDVQHPFEPHPGGT